VQGIRGNIRQQTLVRPCTIIGGTSHEYKVTILQNKQLQTNRTILNNESDIMIRDNEKGTCMLINVAIPEDRNVITKKAEKISTYRELNNRNSAHVECESKSDVSNNKGYWNHFKITHKIPEQNRGKSRN
jgi:hypothetical protein